MNVGSKDLFYILLPIIGGWYGDKKNPYFFWVQDLFIADVLFKF